MRKFHLVETQKDEIVCTYSMNIVSVTPVIMSNVCFVLMYYNGECLFLTLEMANLQFL